MTAKRLVKIFRCLVGPRAVMLKKASIHQYKNNPDITKTINLKLLF